MVVEYENEFYVKEAKDMVNIVQRLVADGKQFFYIILPSLHRVQTTLGSGDNKQNKTSR